MKASFGPLQVNLRYTYSREGTLYYQRPIPKELQPRYGKKLVKVKLKSADVLLASREVDRLNRQVEAEWERLRAEPTSSPQALRAHAVSLLRDWGLADQPAKNDPSIVEVFFEFLDGKRPNHAVEDEDQRTQPNPVDYLSPTEREAAKLLAGRVEVRMSDALEFYLNTHTKRDDAKFSADARRVFDGLMNVIGDKPFESVTRADARSYVDAELARGSATTSVRRRLSTIVAVFTRYAREHEISRPNPFAELKIAGEGTDSKEREPLTPVELEKTVVRCKEMDDDAWNASADHHRRSAEWARLTDAVAGKGFSCLDSTLTEQLQQVGVTGKSVIQLGCNNGREVLSLFALGALEVVGVDQSSAFLKQAQELAERSQYSPEFIEADIHALPATLNERFDVALITIGVVNWMPDLGLFFSHVARTLKPGGTLVIYETHPFLEMLDPEASDPWRISGSYFQTEPVVETGAIVYEGKGEATGQRSYWNIHRLGDLLMGVLGAGLRLRAFNEYAHSNREDLYDVYTQGVVQVPMCYALVAEKL